MRIVKEERIEGERGGDCCSHRSWQRVERWRANEHTTDGERILRERFLERESYRNDMEKSVARERERYGTDRVYAQKMRPDRCGIKRTREGK